jgi:hypothetical protein
VVENLRGTPSEQARHTEQSLGLQRSAPFMAAVEAAQAESASRPRNSLILFGLGYREILHSVTGHLAARVSVFEKILRFGVRFSFLSGTRFQVPFSVVSQRQPARKRQATDVAASRVQTGSW